MKAMIFGAATSSRRARPTERVKLEDV